MIKSSFVLTVALCLTWLLRRRAASERHAICAAAIISAAVLPIFTWLLPSWESNFLQRMAAALPSISAANSPQDSSATIDVSFHAAAIERAGAAHLWSVVWLCGSAAAFAIFGAGLIQQRWLTRRTVSSSDAPLSKVVADVASELGCRRTIYVRRSSEKLMPMTWGVLRPQILLPDDANDWPRERTQVVIAHELAHVKRLDRLFHAVAQIACAVYWFNPLFWMARNRLYRESEHACDDVVLNLGIDGRHYASHLLNIARELTSSRASWSATLAMARPTALEKRFEALLKSGLNRRAMTPQTFLLVSLLTLALVLPLAAMHLPESASNITIPANTVRADSAPSVEQYTTPPLYSDEARALGIEGIVSVDATIGPDGSVKRLQVGKRLGHGLDENALLAVRDWRFSPARRNGKPVEATTRAEVEFNLRNAELNEEIANDMATRIGPGVSPPQIIHRVEPRYPFNASAANPDDAVVLDAVILEDGTPKIVRVIQSRDWELDEIAINALKQWKFSPATIDGQPVKVRMNIAVHF
jgi:TonB family protein